MVVSDNGRTFKPAAREITRIFNDPGVKEHFAKEHMKWTFNLEKAPWWGGVFERLVKSVKRCLKKAISGVRLTYEELLTVIIEVQMILNCRPLSYVSSEHSGEPAGFFQRSQVTGHKSQVTGRRSKVTGHQKYAKTS